MKTVTLIGMPGSGKSTVGPLLAPLVGLAHMDTDAYLEAALGTTLQDIMDQAGVEGFLRLEADLLMDMLVSDCVLSTGGSVIYSPPLMKKLSGSGPVVFLDAALATVRDRIGTAAGRGLVLSPAGDLCSLYAQRRPLYRSAADLAIKVDGLSPDTCALRIAAALKEHGLFEKEST